MSPNRPAQYPIRVTASLTGLSIDTLRAWERRYQAVTPLRGDRGRVYGDEQVHRLILLRNAVSRGHAIGQIASLTDAQLEKLLEGPAAAASAPAASGEAAGGLQPIVDAIESFNQSAAYSQLARMAALLPVRDFVDQVVIPLMRLVGDRWHDGTMSIAQEHMTSSILRNLLGSMVRIDSASGQHARILFATPAGELHEFGILVSAMLAVASGFEAVYLGTNLPAREIVDAVARTSPRVVVLGIKARKPGAMTLEALRTVASSLPEQTELWLGGVEVNLTFPFAGEVRVLALKDFAELDLNLARLKRGTNEAVLEVPV